MVDQSGISAFPEILEANRAYADNFGDKAKLVGAPSRRLAILTCMDARIDPARFARPQRGRRARDP